MTRARILAALEGIEAPEAWDQHGAESRQEARLEIALLRALDRAERAEVEAADGALLVDSVLSVAKTRAMYRGVDVREALDAIMRRIDTAEDEAGTCAEAVMWAAGHLGIGMPKSRCFLASELAPAVALACGKVAGGAPLWVRVAPASRLATDEECAELDAAEEARARGVMVGPGYGGTSGGDRPPPSNLSGMELEAERQRGVTGGR